MARERPSMLKRALRAFARTPGLVRGGYDVLHLRAGSKKWAGGKVALQTLAHTIDQRFPDLASYLQQLQGSYEGTCCHEGGRLPLVILSDAAWLAQAWLEKTGAGSHLNHHLDGAVVGSGIHQARPDDLRVAGVDKFDINLDSLRDFAVMLNACLVVFEGVSLFSKMADECKESIDEGWTFLGSPA